MKLTRKLFYKVIKEHDHFYVLEHRINKSHAISFKQGLTVPPQTEVEVNVLTGDIKLTPLNRQAQ